MRTMLRALMFALLATLAAGDVALAQTSKGKIWVGSWGYVASPLPPGAPPPTPLSAFPQPVPLLAPPAASGQPAGGPVLENPGGIAVDNSSNELTDRTIRQLVRVSLGGQRLRLRLSNESGTSVLALAAVRIGLAGADGQVVQGSDRLVTFDGRSGVVVPAGAPLLSDPVALPTRSLDKLLISIHVPGLLPVRGTRSLFHYVADQPGDFTASAALPGVRLARAPALVSLVEVEADASSGAVVTLGDSITEGALSTGNAFRSWPDRLAERLAASRQGRNWAVVNAGISGNRLLRYGSGPSALARLDRDVLSVPGVKVLILLEGINDIGRSFSPTGTTEAVTGPALRAAVRQIAERARARGIRVLGATLAPYKGAFYYSEAGEAARQEHNQWIRSSEVFDGVVDFAPALADPADPLAFDPRYNDRDRLHPNDAGYKAMADVIDLSLIAGR